MYTCMLLVANALLSRLDPQFVALFQAREFSYTGGRHHEETFRYRLYMPHKLHDRCPLLLWLHGAGESGRDNERNLRWLDQLIPPSEEKGGVPFFILVVQCQGHDSPWYHVARSSSDGMESDTQTNDMLDVAFAILHATIDEYPIDPNRIYLSGISSGGSACWELAIRHPEVFAAVAPLGSIGSTNRDLKSIVNTPVWAFHSDQDENTPVEAVRTTIYALRTFSGNAHLTEIHSTDHNCWTDAFGKYGLMDWLLSRRRGICPAGPPPGTVSLRWRLRTTVRRWQSWLSPAVIVTAIMSGTIFFVWRRNHRARGDAKVRELPSMDELLCRY